MISELKKLRVLCNKSECSFFYVVAKSVFYRMNGVRNLFSANRVDIKGAKNFILDRGMLLLGLRNVGHVSNKTPSYYNVRGKLILRGSVSFGRGCRVDINEGAELICQGGYIGPENTFIVYNGIDIGEGCNISWGCQFLDDDFHVLNYENKKSRDKKIHIGSFVWIGCNVSVLKGSHIASGCVIAANSVVSGDFLEEKCLIAGNPAKVVKRNISWDL
ncbi:Putative acetyltransferase SACOL2570 [Serratia quinivorans]|nr:Putative acetyltransferase SACOL2570 [Serratia quinivorans]